MWKRAGGAVCDALLADGDKFVNIARYKHGDEFAVLDLIATYEFKSATTISFVFGRYTDTLLGLPVAPHLVFDTVGWLDVHHPCEGHIKVKIRIGLPSEYLISERMCEIVRATFVELGIPPDKTYDAHFVTPLKHACIDQSRDRDGLSNRLYS
jgi:hypothetical protein